MTASKLEPPCHSVIAGTTLIPPPCTCGKRPDVLECRLFRQSIACILLGLDLTLGAGYGCLMNVVCRVEGHGGFARQYVGSLETVEKRVVVKYTWKMGDVFGAFGGLKEERSMTQQ